MLHFSVGAPLLLLLEAQQLQVAVTCQFIATTNHLVLTIFNFLTKITNALWQDPGIWFDVKFLLIFLDFEKNETTNLAKST